ncbi:PREDICTED: ATP-binding cassette sub-family G member 2-like [Hipposideros armiger]|uniref:ABC-type xenobiotic transporter n=1 Tax=Hipposideros armiger TaxID=186990 RepID=A0A8B7QKY0_HIPAR|nr:PREDICTED: ATP-binding cassette sub-family G member 2-like [Hipposideros armiger]
MSSSNDQVFIPMSQRNSNGLTGTTPNNLKSFTEGAVLSFHNVCYRVKVKSGFLLGRKIVEKEILMNVNGIMRPGLNAILGPTGGGKSSCLALCKMLVIEDDVVMGTLTVRENLQFSAALRLPTTMTNHEKNERINMVIQELGLAKVADSKVSGKTGWYHPRMSKHGRTIIISIHQPRYSIFKLFDSLTLLASGRVIFHGPAQEALGYFASAGHQCEPYNNPADFFLDVINGDSSAVILNREDEGGEAKETEEPSTREKPLVEKLAEFYINSTFFRETKAELDQLSGVQKKKKSVVFKELTYATSFCHQLKWISRRSFKNLLGNPQVSKAQVIVTIFLGLVIGAIFYDLKSDPTGIQNRIATLSSTTILFCISASVYKGLKPAVESFFIMMFTLMMVAYSASSMALALAAGQSVVSIATLLTTISFVFMMVSRNCTPLRSNYCLSFLPVNSVSWKPCLEDSVNRTLSSKEAIALQHNEFLGQNFCPGLNVTANNTCSFAICTGEEFLINQGIDLSPWGLWRNHVALACMTVIFLTIAYLKLLFLKKFS